MSHVTSITELFTFLAQACVEISTVEDTTMYVHQTNGDTYYVKTRGDEYVVYIYDGLSGDETSHMVYNDAYCALYNSTDESISQDMADDMEHEAYARDIDGSVHWSWD